MKIIQAIPPKQSKDTVAAIDLEIFGMSSKQLHRPQGTFAALGVSFDGKTVYVITEEKDV